MQNDEPRAHLPPVHSREQQSLAPAQGFPADLQLAPVLVQVPFVQTPLQHAPAAEHACPSAVQAFVEHLPLTQESEQQSVPTEQLVPSTLQTAIDDLQVLLVPSQMPEQHPMLVVQVAPEGRH